MKFVSTRGQTPALGFSDAVATGLAPDGGLYLPESLPQFTAADLARFTPLPYAELCFEFLKLFATDIEPTVLRAIIARSYTKFAHHDIAPIVRLDDRTSVLELFHGPTLAFKDFALQLLGNLYEHQCATRHQSINVLGATSGDTGSAAIHGLLGKPGTAIFILYPDGRTSPLQERQMACTGADNVYALAVDGSFDDAQAALKDIFADQIFRTHHRLSAVNSINLARVLAQCVYYLYAYLRLPVATRNETEFVVPRVISATCSPAGCSRKWACRSTASRSPPTKTTFFTACSPRATTACRLSLRRSRRRWIFRYRATSSASSI